VLERPLQILLLYSYQIFVCFHSYNILEEMQLIKWFSFLLFIVGYHWPASHHLFSHQAHNFPDHPKVSLTLRSIFTDTGLVKRISLPLFYWFKVVWDCVVTLATHNFDSPLVSPLIVRIQNRRTRNFAFRVSILSFSFLSRVRFGKKSLPQFVFD
jgi:hypothetical protein